MSSFEEQKEEYFDRLIEYHEIFETLIATNDKNCRKIASIMLDPKNKKELKFSNSMIGFVSDVKELIPAIALGKVKEKELEENEGVQSLIKIIKEVIRLYKMGILFDMEKLKAYFESDFKKEINKDGLCTKLAQATFDLIVSFTSNSEKTLDYIFDQLGISLETDQELNDINDKLNAFKTEAENKQKELIATGATKEVKEFKITKEVADAFEKYTNEFHNICEKSIDNTKEIDMDDIIKLMIKIRT